MDRIRHAERAVAVSTRTFVGHAIPVAADGAAGCAKPCAIDRDEVVDLAFQLAVEKRAHASEISRAFFAHRADEIHHAGCANVRRSHRACNRQHRRETATVITDAGRGQADTARRCAVTLHAHVGAFGEYRVEMR